MKLRNVLNIILVSILIIFIQIFFLFDISVFGLISPMVYVFLIIAMPFNTPISIMLLYAFSVGFVIDGFYNTGGMHIIPTLLIAAIRPFILKLLVPQKGFDIGSSISIYSWSIVKVFIFVFSLTFIHHFILFYIESLEVGSIFLIFFRSLFSTLISMLFMFVFLLFKK